MVAVVNGNGNHNGGGDAYLTGSRLWCRRALLATIATLIHVSATNDHRVRDLGLTNALPFEPELEAGSDLVQYVGFVRLYLSGTGGGSSIIRGRHLCRRLGRRLSLRLNCRLNRRRLWGQGLRRGGGLVSGSVVGFGLRVSGVGAGVQSHVGFAAGSVGVPGKALVHALSEQREDVDVTVRTAVTGRHDRCVSGGWRRHTSTRGRRRSVSISVSISISVSVVTRFGILLQATVEAPGEEVEHTGRGFLRGG